MVVRKTNHNIIENDEIIEKGLTHNEIATKEIGLTNLTTKLHLKSLKLYQLPVQIAVASNLVELDLSDNNLLNFPGKFVQRSFPQLALLNLENNRLSQIEEVLLCSTSPCLVTLNLTGNPLRLIYNRIYLLEALFSSPKASKKNERYFKTSPPSVSSSLTPRNTGFPMLSYLNSLPISRSEIELVEQELGYQIRLYYSNKSSSTNHKTEVVTKYKKLRLQKKYRTLEEKTREANFRGFLPPPIHASHFRNETSTDEENLDYSSSEEMTYSEWNELQHQLNLGSKAYRPNDTVVEDSSSNSSTITAIMSTKAAATTWASADSDKKGYHLLTRHHNKTSETYVDCVNRVSASRDLTNAAIEKLQQSDKLPATDVTVATCHDLNPTRLKKTYGKSESLSLYKLHQDYCENPPSVFASENIHLDINSVLRKQQREASKVFNQFQPRPHSAKASGDLKVTLQRMALRNAVEFSPIVGSNVGKDFERALIDSDRQVFEEEAARARQQEHLAKLAAIANNSTRRTTAVFNPKRTRGTQSSWQKRNARAAAWKQPKRKVTTTAEGRGGYRKVETVEEALRDTLPHATSREVILRCADIRKTAKTDLQNLHHSSEEFIHQELAWDEIRKDKLKMLTRRIERQADAAKARELKREKDAKINKLL